MRKKDIEFNDFTLEQIHIERNEESEFFVGTYKDPGYILREMILGS